MARRGSGRGGPRQGTPGKGYANRTDLLTNYGQSAPGASPASGGQVAPAPQQQAPQQPWITPDQVPKLDDPTAYPNVPLTYGLSSGPGAGPEAIGTTPGDPALMDLRAAYMRNPTEQLRRVIEMLNTNRIF